jgi:four helix bundle protein
LEIENLKKEKKENKTMKEKADVISERLLDYGAEIIRICSKLNKDTVGHHIKGQLLRSGTSVGANYEEACGAQSRADFIHKMQIVLKEIRESMYWLKLIERTQILEEDGIKKAIKETEGIGNIIGKSIVTAKETRKKR